MAFTIVRKDGHPLLDLRMAAMAAGIAAGLAAALVVASQAEGAQTGRAVDAPEIAAPAN